MTFCWVFRYRQYCCATDSTVPLTPARFRLQKAGISLQTSLENIQYGIINTSINRYPVTSMLSRLRRLLCSESAIIWLIAAAPSIMFAAYWILIDIREQFALDRQFFLVYSIGAALVYSTVIGILLSLPGRKVVHWIAILWLAFLTYDNSMHVYIRITDAIDGCERYAKPILYSSRIIRVCSAADQKTFEEIDYYHSAWPY